MHKLPKHVPTRAPTRSHDETVHESPEHVTQLISWRKITSTAVYPCSRHYSCAEMCRAAEYRAEERNWEKCFTFSTLLHYFRRVPDIVLPRSRAAGWDSMYPLKRSEFRGNNSFVPRRDIVSMHKVYRDKNEFFATLFLRRSPQYACKIRDSQFPISSPDPMRGMRISHRWLVVIIAYVTYC